MVYMVPYSLHSDYMRTQLRTAWNTMLFVALITALFVPMGPTLMAPLSMDNQPFVRSAFAQQASFSGNVQSRIYHNSGCRYFTCKKCTASFASAEAALAQGYRACKVCRG